MKHRTVAVLATVTPALRRARQTARSVMAGRLALAVLASLILLGWLGTLWSAVPRPGTSDGAGEISEAAAQSLADKFAMLSAPLPRARPSWGPISITESEANSYLKYRGHKFLPPAVHNPEIHIAADQLSGTANVNFDELGQIGTQVNDWGMRILSLIFKGQQRVLAAGKLETANGQGRLTIESLKVGTITLPAGFVNFLVQNYMERRYKIDLSKPFPLPPHVTRIELGAGRATFHRSPRSNR
jgi:hypothetical protein